MQVLGPAAAASGRKPSCGAKPARRGFAEVGGVPLWVRGGGPAGAPACLAVLAAQSQGHIPIPGRGIFP